MPLTTPGSTREPLTDADLQLAGRYGVLLQREKTGHPEWDPIIETAGALLQLLQAEVAALRLSATASAQRPNALRFGLYTITETADPGKVHVFHDSGEGGEFDKTRLGLVLAGFFSENF